MWAKKLAAMFVAAVIIFSAATPAFAEDNPNVIRVTGQGYGSKSGNSNGSFYRNYARQAARFDALRRLAEAIGGVQINAYSEEKGGRTTIDDLIATSKADEKIAAKLSKAKQVGEVKFLTDKNGFLYCELEMELSLK